MAMGFPAIDDDLFSREAVLDARAVDDRLRELAPVVWLNREDIAMLGRWEHVSAGLRDWESFSNTSRPWHDPNSVRPEILLTDDPPEHTRVRTIVGSALSPRTLKVMEAHFQKIAVTRDLGTVVEVSEGVKPGDQVVLNPPVNLAEGGKVDVRPETPVPTS